MGAFTLEQAKQNLNMWLEAERAVAAGQSYQIGTRRLDRANLYQIRQQIIMWRNEVERLEAKGRNKSFRITPRDL